MNNLKEYIIEKFKISKNINLKNYPWEVEKYRDYDYYTDSYEDILEVISQLDSNIEEELKKKLIKFLSFIYIWKTTIYISENEINNDTINIKDIKETKKIKIKQFSEKSSIIKKYFEQRYKNVVETYSKGNIYIEFRLYSNFEDFHCIMIEHDRLKYPILFKFDYYPGYPFIEDVKKEGRW